MRDVAVAYSRSIYLVLFYKSVVLLTRLYEYQYIRNLVLRSSKGKVYCLAVV
jgi:hypothetical protein